MSNIIIPKGYKSVLSTYDTQVAIGKIKTIFEKKLSTALNLKRVSAPLFVFAQTGLNDDLNGVERAVTFEIKETGSEVQIVHSLAKWKRMALHKYKFNAGNGLYTDMNAIRRDEELDNLHSVYVDQWDWEKVITEADRNLATLKDTVTKIVGAICDSEEELSKKFPALVPIIKREVTFITSQELEDLYPSLNQKARENAFTNLHKTVFIMQIGDVLKSGEKHDGRAPDYDDWSLNGDILFWNDNLQCAIEISSMGIRVDPKSLEEQLKKANCEDRKELLFHKMLLEGKLPLTMGGGIGQSRLCMLLLRKAHIGEVQVSAWDDNTQNVCAENGIKLL